MSTEKPVAPAPQETKQPREGGEKRGGRGGRGTRGGHQNRPEGEKTEKPEGNQTRQPRGENKGERTEDHKPRGGNRGGKFQHSDDGSYRVRQYKPGQPLPGEDKKNERFQNRKPIYLKHKFHEVIPFLTPEQQTEIKELDAKIKEFGTIPDPPRAETDKQVILVDIEITNADKDIHKLQNEKDMTFKQLNEAKSRLPNFQRAKEISAEITALTEQRNAAIDRIKAIKGKLTENSTKFKEEKAALGGTSVDDIDARIEEIEERIQLESLDNNKLKALLTEIDRLKASRDKMGKFDVLKQNGDKLKADSTTLQVNVEELKEKINRLYDERKEINAKADPEKASIEKFKAQLDELSAKINAAYDKLKAAKAKRRAIVEKFYDEYDTITKNKEELEKLSYNKKLILRQAEWELEKKSRQGDDDDDGTSVVIIKNPHEKEFMAACSLISYLTDIQKKHMATQDAAEAQEDLTGGKMVSKKELDLISSLKKPKKAKKARKAETTMSHSLKTMEQFAILELAAPNDVSEISATVEILKQKKKEYDFVAPPPIPASQVQAEEQKKEEPAAEKTE